MSEQIKIDVTVIEPQLKHLTAFNAFDQLEPGDAILLNNDHDPKPLYYQLLGERGNIFSWSYLQSGPDTWIVEIRKNNEDDQPETLGEIVSKDLRKATIFQKFGLDFCCGGKKNLEEACKEKGLDIGIVKQTLEDVSKIESTLPSHDFNNWSLSFLADYIINVHHAYVKQNSPLLSDLSLKVTNHHGKTNPELISINRIVEEIVAELKSHMKKEESILFPYIKRLEASIAEATARPLAFNSVRQPISVMEHDHDIVGDLFRQMRSLSDNYMLPASACNSYALLYKKLEEFENDLHLHVHLENNILFPKAVKAESGI